MRTIVIGLFLSIQISGFCQVKELGAGSVLQVHILYGAQAPGGDLDERFGGSFLAGLGADYMTRNNILFGVQSSFLFGSKVKTDVIAPLRNQDGLIFGDNFSISDYRLRERGIYFGAHAGKVFSLNSENPRSGIRVTVGGGFLQHKIRIQDSPLATVSLLSGDYKKGYDRLSNGISLTQFIGWQMLSRNRRLNFLAGFEFYQGFTQGRRSFNFDTRSRESEKRLDLLFGVRLGWTLPFYVGENADEIQY